MDRAAAPRRGHPPAPPRRDSPDRLPGAAGSRGPTRGVTLPGHAVDSAAMGPPAPRRLVILTEGQWHVHNAKTAIGVVRYGTDRVVALLDSAIAGRNGAAGVPGPR